MSNTTPNTSSETSSPALVRIFRDAMRPLERKEPVLLLRMTSSTASSTLRLMDGGRMSFENFPPMTTARSSLSFITVGTVKFHALLYNV